MLRICGGRSGRGNGMIMKQRVERMNMMRGINPSRGWMATMAAGKGTKGSGKPYFMKLWYLFASSAVVGMGYYYINESDRYERSIERIIKLVESPSTNTVKDAIKSLDDSLSLKTSLFTGNAKIPQPKDTIAKSDLIDKVIDVLGSDVLNDTSTKETALGWLSRLSSHDLCRERIFAKSDSLLGLLDSHDTDSAVHFSASYLLLKLAQHENKKKPNGASSTFLGSDQMSASLERMQDPSSHPVCRLIGSDLSSEIFPETSTVSSSSTVAFAADSALKAALDSISPASLITGQTASDYLHHLGWATGFGVFAMMYGQLRSYTTNLFTTGQFRPLINSRCKAGRSVFILLVLDMLTQGLMSWPGEGLSLPFFEEPLKLPYLKDPEEESEASSGPSLKRSALIPIEGSVAFAGLGLFFLNRHRYIVLPLAAAFLDSHANIRDPAAFYSDVVSTSQRTINQVRKMPSQFIASIQVPNFKMPSFQELTASMTSKLSLPEIPSFSGVVDFFKFSKKGEPSEVQNEQPEQAEK